ncbi:MAG: hypothetical protein KJZ80_02785 [Hyphomicrobiaceae bacterium]|nr:hypothetical protein [Hyphomicrobiaceae bacterium]
MKNVLIGMACAALVLALGAEMADSLTPGGSGRAGPQAQSAVRVDQWPKSVDEFLAGNYLERADVVLARREWDPASYVIRWATSSPFSHSAMIFTGPVHEPGYASTFVIEASTGGVDLSNFRDYVDDKSAIVAIKRLRRDWFDAGKQSRVRGLLLENIKADYNYWAIVRIVRDIWFGIQKSIEGQEKAVDAFRDREWTPPNSYICSGLVQIGFVEAISEFVLRRQLPPWALNEVVFHPGAASRLPPPEAWKDAPPSLIDDVVPQFRVQLATELEAVTPEDLARSDKLEWLYFISGGKVHKVSSYEDVKKLMQ